MALTIRFFRSYSKKAEDLREKIEEEIPSFLRNKGFESTVIVEESKGLNPENGKNASAFNVLQSALKNEIVVIDASIESVDGEDLGINYECITPIVSSLDNILLVSRTQLPLNLIPCRTNVAPLGQKDLPDCPSVKDCFGNSCNIDGKFFPNNDLTTYKKEYSNEYIIAWLEYILMKMHENGRLFRDGLLSFDVLEGNTEELFQREMEIIRENQDAIKKEQGYKLKSFISYRSIYYPKKDHQKKYNGKYDIFDVIAIIDQHHHDPSHEVWEEPFVYPSGVLSNELMPEVRRWAFVAMPDRVIREADEFWIFETKHKKDQNGKTVEYGYWDSWWCLGEFVTIMRMKHDNQLRRSFKVKIFDPDTDKIEEIPHDVIPSITDEQNRELARYFANGDFLEAGYESMGAMRTMSKMPILIRWIFFLLLKRFVWPKTKMMTSEDLKQFRFRYYNESVKSHVYKEAFMKNRILINSEEQERGFSRKEVFNCKNLIWFFLNINGCYTKKVAPYPGASIVNEKTTQLVETGENFYIFWLPRMGKRTGPNSDGSIMEIVPIVEKTKEKENYRCCKLKKLLFGRRFFGHFLLSTI